MTPLLCLLHKLFRICIYRGKTENTKSDIYLRFQASGRHLEIYSLRIEGRLMSVLISDRVHLPTIHCCFFPNVSFEIQNRNYWW